MAQIGQAPIGGPVKCDFPSYDCQTYFRRRYDMLRHKREFHQDPKHCPYPECFYTTKRLDRIIKHINDIHAVTLDVAHDLTSQQSPSSNPEVEHQGIINSDALNHDFVPKDHNTLRGAIGTPDYFTNWGYTNFNASQLMPHGMATEPPAQTFSEAPAPTIVNYDPPEASSCFSSEAAQNALINPETIQPNEEARSSAPNYAEAAFPYGSYGFQGQCPSSNTSAAPATQISPETSAFPNEATYSSQYGHYPIHAAALSMDTGLYEADHVFDAQYNDGASNNFQP